MIHKKKLLTTEEVAERWQIKPHTLRKWRSEGAGPDYVRIGGLIRYREEDLERFVAAGSCSAGEKT